MIIFVAFISQFFFYCVWCYVMQSFLVGVATPCCYALFVFMCCCFTVIYITDHHRVIHCSSNQASHKEQAKCRQLQIYLVGVNFMGLSLTCL